MNDFEPGDVVMVGQGRIALVRRRMVSSNQALEFAYASAGYDMVGDAGLVARRLVVIDPEDAEQLERLDTAMDDAFRKHDPAGWERADEWADGVAVRVLTDALREFANPTPRIEEPTGFGALVEDGEGVRYVRIQTHDASPWVRQGSDALYLFRDVEAVRVLSHGVTEDC